MKALKRLARPLFYSSILGIGGYYLYNNYQLNNLQHSHSKSQVNTQILSSDIPQLLQHQSHHHQTPNQNEDLKLQKEESLEKHQELKTSQKESQKSIEQNQSKPQQQNENLNQQKTQQNNKDSQLNTTQLSSQKQAKGSQQTLQQKQPEQKVTEIIPTENTAQKAQDSIQQKPEREIAATQQKQQVQKKNEPKIHLDLSKIQRLSEIPQLSTKTAGQLKTTLVVADMGYTQQFQQKLLQTIRNLKNIPNSQDIQIFRVNITDDQAQQQLSNVYKHKIKEETIFLIKNELDDNFVDINFEMYMQYPTLINTYMTKLNLYNSANKQAYFTKLQKMSPNQAYLLFIYDDSEPQQNRSKNLLAAKYIEMQLALHHLDHAIKVVPVEASLVQQSKLIPPQNIRSKSLHIIRKHNEFTHAHPNLHIKLNEQIVPYHLLADVGFHNKRGQVAIQSYLSKIQTFNSLSITTPYILSVTIDKNRITTQNYKLLMETFKTIKRKNPFPDVGIALKFGEVGYLGKNQPQNNQYCIKMANVAELQNQSSMHQIQSLQDAKTMGITEQNWLMNSFQFLYPHQIISEQLISDFVGNVLSNQIPHYYRSDKPSSVQNVHRIVGSNFNKQILDNNQDHFVFQYSDHCPACTMIGPLIGYINEILQPIPVTERFDIHVMNCQKNRAKGQVYSPYTPNMNYFKKQWKHTGPVKIGLETIKFQGLVGLYDFCLITKLLKSIDSKKFNQNIQNAKLWNKAEFVL